MGFGSALPLGEDQGLVNQPCEAVEQLEVITSGHGRRRPQRPCSGKDRQHHEEFLLVRLEVVIAPLHGGPQRAVTLDRGAATPRQQTESVVQHGADLADRERPRANRGELDGQGDAVETPADLRHVDRIRFVQHELLIYVRCAIDEETHRLGPADGLDARTARFRRQGQAADGKEPFAFDAQTLAAGGEKSHIRSLRQHSVGEVGAGVEQVLAIVEHEQRLGARESVEDAFERARPRLLLQAERLGHFLRDKGVGGKRS